MPCRVGNAGSGVVVGRMAALVVGAATRPIGREACRRAGWRLQFVGQRGHVRR